MRKKNHPDSAILAIGVLLLILPVAAQAELRTWAMEGTIESVSDPLGLIGFAQVTGHVRYTFTFDSDAPNTAYPPGQSGQYSGLSAAFSVAPQAIPTGAPTLEIWRGSYQHQSDAFNVQSWLTVDGMSGSVYFRLKDLAGTALAGPQLPLEPYPLSSFSSAAFSCTVVGPPSPNNPTFTPLLFSGTVDSFYAVPEPCSLLVLALAGSVLAIRRK